MGVVCARKMKKKVYKIAVRPAVTYCLEMVALRKRQDVQIFIGLTRRDKIGNECITGTAEVRQFGDEGREERLRWFGNVELRDSGYTGWRMLKMELPSKKKKGRPQRRFMDV